jgi:hypothetical protein
VVAVNAVLTLAAFLLLFAGVGMAIKHRNPFWLIPWWVSGGLVEALDSFLVGQTRIGWILVIISSATVVIWAVLIVVAAHMSFNGDRSKTPPQGR